MDYGGLTSNSLMTFAPVALICCLLHYHKGAKNTGALTTMARQKQKHGDSKDSRKRVFLLGRRFYLFSVRVFVLVFHCSFYSMLPSVRLSVVCAPFVPAFLWFSFLLKFVLV